MNLEKLEEARKEKGISVTNLAKELGIHRSTWHRWVSGKRKQPGFEDIARACKVLGVDMAEIMQ